MEIDLVGERMRILILIKSIREQLRDPTGRKVSRVIHLTDSFILLGRYQNSLRNPVCLYRRRQLH